MRYISQQPPEYVQCIQAMRAWLDQEYQLYQLPSVLQHIIWSTIGIKLHDMVDDLIRYEIGDDDQLTAWDDLPIREHIGSYFDNPKPMKLIQSMYHKLENLALDENVLASMIYRNNYDLKHGVLTPKGGLELVHEIAYNTSELLQSGIDYYRPMDTLRTHFKSPVQIITPDTTSVLVDDPHRCIIIRVD